MSRIPKSRKKASVFRLFASFGRGVRRRLTKKAADEFRRVTPSELDSIGLSRTSERYVEEYVRRLTLCRALTRRTGLMASWLIEAAPKAWAEDREALEFPYQAYKTFGAAVVSSKTWRFAGHWLAGMRRAEIQHVSLKRTARALPDRARPTALFGRESAGGPSLCSIPHLRPIRSGGGITRKRRGRAEDVGVQRAGLAAIGNDGAVRGLARADGPYDRGVSGSIP